MIKSLSHISLTSRDLKKVEKFYTKILNFKIAHRFINHKNETYGLFIFCNNRTFLEFFQDKKLKKKESSKLRHISFEVKNIYRIRKKLSKYFPKIKIKRGKTDGVLQFFVKDFENNILEFQSHDEKSKLKKFLS